MGEKRHYFGIRRLKVGVASVVIASGFLLGNAQLVQADETSTSVSPATEAVYDANAAAQPNSANEEKTGEADSSGAGASEQAAPTGVLADQAPASAGSEAVGQEAANPSEKDLKAVMTSKGNIQIKSAKKAEKIKENTSEIED